MTKQYYLYVFKLIVQFVDAELNIIEHIIFFIAG